MSAPNLILVVDDDFATLDFLRSILELSEGDFDVLGVPSAEEALLALKRARFDLLVADVRLPGMDGLQLAQRAGELSPDIPVIMITGYDSAEAEQEADRLGVAGYLTKPLDAEDFMSAVSEALSGLASGKGSVATAVDGIASGSVPPAVVKRLETLRADIGASQVILAAISGAVLVCSGGQQDQQLQQLVTAIAFSMDRNFHLSDQLGGSQPQAIQFLVGERSDLYCANIDRDYFVAILFDAQVRRGRIGTVWVFTQRAIKELRSQLAESWVGEEDASATPATNRIPMMEDSSESPSSDKNIDQMSEHGIPAELDDLEESGEEIEPPGLVRSGDDETNGSPEAEALDLAAIELEGSDLETLLEETAGEDEDEQPSISFEEAKKLGIIAFDFNPEDE